MPILSDFSHIVGDEIICIGDNSNASGFVKTFPTGGRDSSSRAFISFMIKGLTAADQDAIVFLNDREIGRLRRNTGGNDQQWQTQSITMRDSDLNNGSNVLRINPVPLSGGGSNNFDDYYITNVICHFHQKA